MRCLRIKYPLLQLHMVVNSCICSPQLYFTLQTSVLVIQSECFNLKTESFEFVQKLLGSFDGCLLKKVFSLRWQGIEKSDNICGKFNHKSRAGHFFSGCTLCLHILLKYSCCVNAVWPEICMQVSSASSVCKSRRRWQHFIFCSTSSCFSWWC